ncbi:MAG: DUF2809 domain-containing protein [Oscillospiraceae bacterium]|nr:DUF2809 domain-containing protein [Oscillospiraceae bacterium]
MSAVKQRLIWAAAFLILLGTEVCIALFVHDSFVRPYLGDVLAVITVYCGARIVFPHRFTWLSAAVMALAIGVELIQLTELSSFFGKDSFISVLMGATFDWHDILCYCTGGVLCAATDLLLFIRKGKKND